MARSSLRLLVASAGVLFAGLVVVSPVHAHTDFDFSLPADGATVAMPLDEITVAFTSPVTLVGAGFEVLDPDGRILEPEPSSDDDAEFRLAFDPPLAGGDVGVRYTVRAEDGHELTGAFSFTIAAASPTSSTAPASTTAAPAPTSPVAPTTASTTAAPAVAPTTSAPAPTSAPTETTDAPPDSSAVPIEEAGGDDDGDGDDGGPWLVILVVAALAVGATGFYLVRARTSA